MMDEPVLFVDFDIYENYHLSVLIPLQFSLALGHFLQMGTNRKSPLGAPCERKWDF